MGLRERLCLYEKLEAMRKCPLIVYVTSSRQGAQGKMAADAVGEILSQLQSIPMKTKTLDFLIASFGGDPTVAWRIVSLIREKVRTFSVLVPQAAFSAATLIALGADEIVMHPHGNLGPVDPQITVNRKTSEDGPPQQFSFGSEDLAAFLEFARGKVGLTDQSELLRVFELFCKEVGSVPIGVATRSSQLSLSMGEKLLRMHMRDEGQSQQARTIAESLNKDFFHHGYPVGRSEAKEIGLKISRSSTELENILWDIWLDIESELKHREPFNPMSIISESPGCQPLFAPLRHVDIPANLPPQILESVYNQILGQIPVVPVPPVKYELINAVVESSRICTRFTTEGKIFASRLPDLQIRINVVPEKLRWQTVDLGSIRNEGGTQ